MSYLCIADHSVVFGSLFTCGDVSFVIGGPKEVELAVKALYKKYVRGESVGVKHGEAGGSGVVADDGVR